jgi:hypothetical protein
MVCFIILFGAEFNALLYPVSPPPISPPSAQKDGANTVTIRSHQSV